MLLVLVSQDTEGRSGKVKASEKKAGFPAEHAPLLTDNVDLPSCGTGSVSAQMDLEQLGVLSS